jgi:hypothetical protein
VLLLDFKIYEGSVTFDPIVNVPLMENSKIQRLITPDF